VALVLETGKPIAQVARELGINDGTLGNWVAKARAERDGGSEVLSESERAELARLRKENTELRMQRDVLIGSVGGGTGSMSQTPGDVVTLSRFRLRPARSACPVHHRWRGSAGCGHGSSPLAG
jgi:transposase